MAKWTLSPEMSMAQGGLRTNTTKHGETIISRPFFQKHRYSYRHKENTDDLEKMADILEVLYEHTKQEVTSKFCPNQSCAKNPSIGSMKDTAAY
jgi:hypothetical protein